MNETLTKDQIIKFLEEESDLALRDGLSESSWKFAEAAELIRRLLRFVEERPRELERELERELNKKGFFKK